MNRMLCSCHHLVTKKEPVMSSSDHVCWALPIPTADRKRIATQVTERWRHLACGQTYLDRLLVCIEISDVNSNGWSLPTSETALIELLLVHHHEHMREIGYTQKQGVVTERIFSVEQLLGYQ